MEADPRARGHGARYNKYKRRVYVERNQWWPLRIAIRSTQINRAFRPRADG